MSNRGQIRQEVRKARARRIAAAQMSRQSVNRNRLARWRQRDLEQAILREELNSGKTL